MNCHGPGMESRAKRGVLVEQGIQLLIALTETKVAVSIAPTPSSATSLLRLNAA